MIVWLGRSQVFSLLDHFDEERIIIVVDLQDAFPLSSSWEKPAKAYSLCFNDGVSTFLSAFHYRLFKLSFGVDESTMNTLLRLPNPVSVLIFKSSTEHCF